MIRLVLFLFFSGKGSRKIEAGATFPLTALLEEQLGYIQSEHRNAEPRRDDCRFYVADGVNRSRLTELVILIEVCPTTVTWFKRTIID